MPSLSALARRFFEPPADDDLDTYVAADALFHSWPFLERGPAGVRQLRESLAMAFDEHSVEFEDIIEVEDRVVVRATEHGRHVGPLMGIPATGKSFSISMIHIFTFAEGKIVDHWRESDMLGLLQQLGAMPGQFGAD